MDSGLVGATGSKGSLEDVPYEICKLEERRDQPNLKRDSLSSENTSEEIVSDMSNDLISKVIYTTKSSKRLLRQTNRSKVSINTTKVGINTKYHGGLKMSQSR